MRCNALYTHFGPSPALPYGRPLSKRPQAKLKLFVGLSGAKPALQQWVGGDPFS
jgi:hypothetical protein